MTTSPTEEGATRVDGPGRAMIIGTGLIGGSVGMALRAQGWHVSGIDESPGTAARAVALGALDHEGEDRSADLVVVATPVHVAAGVIADVLSSPDWNPDAVVTDVGGVKGPLVAAVDRPRFVGGHPMAGSEQVGIDGASAELFVGATWVLTPTPATDPRRLRPRALGVGRLRGQRGGAGPPGARPPGRRRLPRTPPHRGHPDGPWPPTSARSTAHCSSWPPGASAT